MKFKVTRTDILNYLIKKNKFTTYLEIGVRDPNTGNFNNIKINSKLGVDPLPKVKQDNIYIGTSDDFFLHNKKKFDIIFIDGLHMMEQVDKDIENSLNCLNEGGLLLLHDCNPPTEFHQRENYCVDGKYPSWNGTVWKSIVKLRFNRDDLKVNVIDTDWGVGIISKSQNEKLIDTVDLEYKNLEDNRENMLGLISTNFFYNNY